MQKSGWKHLFVGLDSALGVGLRGPTNLFGHLTDRSTHWRWIFAFKLLDVLYKQTTFPLFRTEDNLKNKGGKLGVFMGWAWLGYERFRPSLVFIARHRPESGCKKLVDPSPVRLETCEPVPSPGLIYNFQIELNYAIFSVAQFKSSIFQIPCSTTSFYQFFNRSGIRTQSKSGPPIKRAEM